VEVSIDLVDLKGSSTVMSFIVNHSAPKKFKSKIVHPIAYHEGTEGELRCSSILAIGSDPVLIM
jgi:hypothetical protein